MSVDLTQALSVANDTLGKLEEHLSDAEDFMNTIISELESLKNSMERVQGDNAEELLEEIANYADDIEDILRSIR